MGGLDDEENIHINPSRRFFWPSMASASSDTHAMTSHFQGRIWIEFGFSAWSLMPFARHPNLYIAFDERPWAKKMMDKSHLQGVVDSYLCLDARFPETPGSHIMQALAESCSKLANEKQIGTAFFIMSRLRGVSRTYDTLDRSIDCSAIKGDKAIIYSKRYSMVPVYMKPKKSSNLAFLQEIGKMIADDADAFHININRPMGEETANIAKSLSKAGFSWSMTISDEQRTVARSISSVTGANVVKIGQCYYAGRGES
jgi:hypothetical protein